MVSGEDRQPEGPKGNDRLRRIEELRAEMHRRMAGRYDPARVASLVEISRELDRLVVEVTRDQRAAGEEPAARRGVGSRDSSRPC